MSNIIINQGEIKVQLDTTNKGKITFKELGLSADDLLLEAGLLRLVFDFGSIEKEHFFKVPTIEIAYSEAIAETHWQCDYNGQTILDKTDHFGKSTVVLLDRSKLDALEHRHENTLVLHAEFPVAVQLLSEGSFIHIF
jgi:hypothetical protein